MIIAVKKNLLFAGYIIFNLFLAFLLLRVEYGYLVTALFVVGGHIRDLIGVMYQLCNTLKITRDLPTVPNEQVITVCCLVPVYNEDVALLRQNLNSLTTQELSANTTVLVVLMFDGVGEHNTELYNSISNALEFDNNCIEERWYQNWKSKEDARLSYRVGKYNDTTVILSHKETNSGKKDSLIIGEKFITTGIPDIGCIETPRVDYIYHTDGDTASDQNCLNEMLKCFVNDSNLDGVSGLLRTYMKKDASWVERGFVIMQDFQYFFSIIVRRMTESLLNSTTCLPGCCNMIRLGPSASAAIEKYENLPTEKTSLLQTVTRMQGTDRRYTTLLLRQGANLQLCWRAFVRTEPPLSARSFINQRRRWSSNSFFNCLVLLYTRHIPLYIRAATFVDIVRVFTTLFRFISYFCFWIYITQFSLTNIIVISVSIAIPYLYSFVWILFIVPEWPHMIGGFFLNKICMPFLSVAAVSKMFMTATNFAWASTSSTVHATPALSPPEPASSSTETVQENKNAAISGYFCSNPKLLYVSQ